MPQPSTQALRCGATILGALAAIALSAPATAQIGSSTYRAILDDINGSGASGTATLSLSGRSLRVRIQATGLGTGGAHLGHVHGLTNDNGRATASRCPTAAQDTDGDGFLELLEGVPVYGPILIDMMNIDPDGDGNVDFTTTVQLSGNEDVIPLNKRHVVVHGQTVPAGPGAGTAGEVDGTAGFKVILPNLCGSIRAVAAGSDPLEFREPR